MTAIFHPRKVRLVRLVTALSLCNCLRLVTAFGVRLVRLVNSQVIENIALGKMESASPRALVTTLLHRPRLLARRACVSRRENEAMTDPSPAAKAVAHAEAAKDNFDWPHTLARVIEDQAEHPNATDWQNRSERAEAECAELRGQVAGLNEAIASAADAVKRLAAAQRKIDALQKHAEAMANNLGLLAEIHADQLEDFPEALQHAQQTLASWTAYLIDGQP